jgi:hypothetical protein
MLLSSPQSITINAQPVENRRQLVGVLLGAEPAIARKPVLPYRKARELPADWQKHKDT